MMYDDAIADNNEPELLESNDHMEQLFARAETARLKAKRFREQSSNQLGLHLREVDYSTSTNLNFEEVIDKKLLYKKEPKSCQKDLLDSINEKSLGLKIISWILYITF